MNLQSFHPPDSPIFLLIYRNRKGGLKNKGLEAEGYEVQRMPSKGSVLEQRVVRLAVKTLLLLFSIIPMARLPSDCPWDQLVIGSPWDSPEMGREGNQGHCG